IRLEHAGARSNPSRIESSANQCAHSRLTRWNLYRSWKVMREGLMLVVTALFVKSTPRTLVGYSTAPVSLDRFGVQGVTSSFPAADEARSPGQGRNLARHAPVMAAMGRYGHGAGQAPGRWAGIQEDNRRRPSGHQGSV